MVEIVPTILLNSISKFRTIMIFFTINSSSFSCLLTRYSNIFFTIYFICMAIYTIIFIHIFTLSHAIIFYKWGDRRELYFIRLITPYYPILNRIPMNDIEDSFVCKSLHCWCGRSIPYTCVPPMAYPSKGNQSLH